MKDDMVTWFQVSEATDEIDLDFAIVLHWLADRLIDWDWQTDKKK